MSPGYAYERAPDQEHFLNRTKTKKLFRDVFALGKGKKWNFMHSGLFLDFLAGNQSYECTPWGMPARNIFGWQKPCYLLGEGYTKTFKELMDTTDWETYGTGKYEKCADCMAHCGYEPTAANAALANPLKAMWVALRGVRTTGPMAPEINLDKQRPAQYIFSAEVQKRLSEIRRTRRRPAERRKPRPRVAASSQQKGAIDRALFSFDGSALQPQRSFAAKSRQRAAAAAQLRSARLKSIPVETSARSDIGLRATPRSTLRRSISPLGLIARHRQRRQRAAGGIADDAQGRERKPGLGGIGGGDMALHVDGRSARLATTARPFRPGRRSPVRRPPGRP